MAGTDIEVWQYGIVKERSGISTLLPYNVKLYQGVLDFYFDKEVEFIVRERKKKISSETHGYYRGIILPCALSAEMFGGWELKDIHNHFVKLFLTDVKELQLNGKTVLVPEVLSTSGISQKEMNEFIMKVRAWLKEHNINTPDPDKLHGKK